MIHCSPVPEHCITVQDNATMSSVSKFCFLTFLLFLVSNSTTALEVPQQRFLGIKFAEALRWESSVEVPFYPDANYNQLPPRCPQKIDDRVVGVEDCLYLNVVTPNQVEDAPVVVWFHGGGFVAGYSGDWVGRAQRFSEAGIVFVAPNYRLGRLGNVSNEFAQGNFALGDMQTALQWVQENIDYFGGNPNNITIMGESAGGMAVQMLMSSPGSEGLFHRAISMSGYGAWPMPVAGEVLDEVALTPEDDIITVVNAVNGFVVPYVDGELLADTPIRVFASGNSINVPLIMGSNSFDGSVMPASGVSPDDLLSMLGHESVEVWDRYKDTFEHDALAVAQLFGELRYGLPSVTLGKSHAEAGNKTYLYYFDYLPSTLKEVLPGAPHGIELPLALGYHPSGVPQELALDNDTEGRRLFAAWVDFVKHGELIQTNYLQASDTRMVVNAIGNSDRLEGYLERLEELDRALMHDK